MESDFRKYSTAGSVRSFLYTLGILTDISARMQEYTLDQGIFLLSDAARFLYGIIGDNDAPFIYEKVGNYFHHFMIDEFQDTSGLQWKNFKPLIDNNAPVEVLDSGLSSVVISEIYLLISPLTGSYP